MADLFNSAVTYTNAGGAGATLGANYRTTTGQGLAGRTVIVSIAGSGGNVSQAELEGTIRGMTTQSVAGAGVAAADAFTVAGITGTVGAGVMHLALQGTGVVGTDAADYFTGVTATVVANFPGLSG